jgi:hypothetical protein
VHMAFSLRSDEAERLGELLIVAAADSRRRERQIADGAMAAGEVRS